MGADIVAKLWTCESSMCADIVAKKWPYKNSMGADIVAKLWPYKNSMGADIVAKKWAYKYSMGHSDSEYQSFKQLSTIPYVGIFIVLFYLSNYLSVVAFLSILNRGERSTFKNSILSILNKKTAAEDC